MLLHSGPTYSDRFVTTNLGSTLILKACGFIQEQHARILEVDKDVLKLRVSTPRQTPISKILGTARPIDIQLEMKELSPESFDEEQQVRLPAAKCSQIEVKITGGFGSWRDSEFDDCARRVMWSLRTHFMAH